MINETEYNFSAKVLLKPAQTSPAHTIKLTVKGENCRIKVAKVRLEEQLI